MRKKIHLLRTDIIPLINYAWPPAFANRDNNLKARRERGWYFYSRVLLLDPMIRATMTEEMIHWEKNSGLFGDMLLKSLHSVRYCESKGVVTLECIKKTEEMNFSGGGTAQYVACSVMSEVDRQKAREINLKSKTEGATAIERFRINKRITSGKLLLEGRQCKLDKTLMESIKERNWLIWKMRKRRRKELN